MVNKEEQIMTNIKRRWVRGMVAGGLAFLIGGVLTTANAFGKGPVLPPKIQVALLLDTSNSMDGLINQAKATLWKIVNEYATAKRDGKPVQLEVALYEYGNNGLTPQDGYIRLAVPLTDNLDRLSEELFKLKTNGGNEFCGQVIDGAVKQLTWDDSRGTLKCIFIAGNEPFTQGPVRFQDACRAAAGKNITVNTIHCGPLDIGARTGWQDGAMLADGSYMAINQDERAVHVEAPQDKDLARLGAELNKTYVAFGAAPAREQALKRQEAQDSNAAGLSSSAAADRAAFKGKGQYNNAGWDLVDACNRNGVKIEEVKEDQLPENLRKMSVEERKKYVEEKTAEREKIQAEINKLSAARGKYIAAEQQKQAARGAKTLDGAMLETVRDQAEKNDFKFSE